MIVIIIIRVFPLRTYAVELRWSHAKFRGCNQSADLAVSGAGLINPEGNSAHEVWHKICNLVWEELVVCRTVDIAVVSSFFALGVRQRAGGSSSSRSSNSSFTRLLLITFPKFTTTLYTHIHIHRCSTDLSSRALYFIIIPYGSNDDNLLRTRIHPFTTAAVTTDRVFHTSARTRRIRISSRVIVTTHFTYTYNIYILYLCT